MSAEEFLRSTENEVLETGRGAAPHVDVRGKGLEGAKKKGFSATVFATALIVVLVVVFASGNLIPAAIPERLIEATDVQHGDAVESEILVFQQALSDDSVSIPTRTMAHLKDHGILVGNVNDDVFEEDTNGSVLKFADEIITADNLPSKMHSDVVFYNNLRESIDGGAGYMAGYYYDEAGSAVLSKLTSRNNYTKDEDLNTVMSRIMGDGSDINANSVALVEKEDKDGKKYYEYETVGSSTNSESEDFVEMVAQKSLAKNSQEANLSAATTLNTASKISMEQRSSLYYVGLMEPFSKMKAGEGSTSKINEVMNYFNKNRPSHVVDTDTNEKVIIYGSMMESPSLYAVLSGEKLNAAKVKNFSTDAILKTTENRLGTPSNGNIISSTITSSNTGIKGSIGRYVSGNTTSASLDTLSGVSPTVNSSLVDNSFESIGGVAGGELLVLGAVNVGKLMARASGATTGDAAAIKSYTRLNNTILAMDAEVDRMNRSPFDITSRNTFLGSILYKFALGMQSSGSIMRNIGSLSTILTNSIAAILPTTRADDEADSILTTFGDCDTLRLSLGVEGTATCATIVTFDTSTLNDPFNDPGFISFVEQNTELKDGVRIVKPDSKLAKFILFNNERTTPDGVTDGSILMALSSGASSATYTSDIAAMTEVWLNSSEEDKRIASGAAFVNSSDNADWEFYKYAQRYVSLARAASTLRQFDGDKTSYVNLKFFEGTENPVMAFLHEYRSLANK